MTENAAHDVLVVGAGLAGLATAVRAAELGLRVTVLERSTEDLYLCNSRYTGGLFHIAMDDMGGAPQWVADNVTRVTRGEMERELAETLAANARRTLAWMQRQGVRFIRAGYDGLRRHSLAPPGIRRTGLAWRGRSGDVMLRTLAEALRRHGGRIERGCEARHLVMTKGRCAGLVVRRNGSETTWLARAVVLADGGFQADPELVARYISPAPEKLLTRNAGTGRGAGLRMASEVGAALKGLDSFYGHLHYRPAMTDGRFWPYPVLDSLAGAGILVDGTGRRFCDEGLGGVYATNAIAKLPDPLSTFVVFDDAIWKGPGRDWLLPANPYLIRAGGELTSGTTLADLAAKTGLPAEALSQTVAAHNDAVLAGKPIEPARTLAAKGWPIRQGPFHALPVCAGITYTMGGILTDTRARVLSEERTVIPGLLAVGATTGGLEGGSFSGYSGGLSKSSVFGLIAGETLAETLQAPKAAKAVAGAANG